MVRFFSKHLIVWITVCVTTQLSTPSFAADPTFTSKLPRDSELVLLNGEEVYRTGRFIRSQDTSLLLKTFDSGKDRFQEEKIALDQITQIRWLQHHRSAAYPIGLSLLMGGLGAFLGYNSGDDGGLHGGDVSGIDQRGQAAFILGLTGFAIGFVLGAVIAPETHSEKTVWTRN